MRMQSKLVPVGNSRGVRLSRPLLDTAGLPDDIEIVAEPGLITIRPARGCRAGWADAAKALAAEAGHDALLDLPTPVGFDEEWSW